MLNLETENPPEDFLIPYLPEFWERRVRELEELKTSNEISDFPSVKKIAHSWAGACAPYGFGALATIARDLERMAEEKNSSQISEAVSEIQIYLNKKKEQIPI